MIIPSIFYAFGAACLIGIYLGQWLHEISHWFLGKIDNSDPEMFYHRIRGVPVTPKQVKHNRIADAETDYIRFFGAVPLIWWIPVVPAIYYLNLGNAYPIQMLYFSMFLMPAVAFSTSDGMAIFEPEQYRQLSLEDALPSRGSGYIYALRQVS